MADERILVVDDEAYITQLCVQALIDLGYPARGVTAGREALACLETQSFDLLLLDIKMPDIDGLTVLHRARELDPTLSAVIITGHATLESTIEALNSGAEGVILKPFDLHDLASAVEIALTRRRKEQERIRLQAQLPILNISQTLMAEGDMEDLHRRLLEAIVQQIGADQASLLLLDEEADQLYIADAIGLPEEMTVGTRIPIDQDGAAQALSQEKPLVLDEHLSPAWQALVNRPETGSVVCLPLQAKGRTIGVLNLGRLAEGPPFTSGDLDLLHIIGGQASMALENARLYRQIRTRSRFLETLQKINATLRSTLPLRDVLDTITHGTGQTLGYRGCVILLPDEKNERLTMGGVWGGKFLEAAKRFTKRDVGLFSLPLETKDNPMARCYLNNEFLSWSGKPEWITTGVEPAIPSALAPAIARAMGAKSAACVPLTVAEEVVGVLIVLSPRAQLSAEEKGVLFSLADQAGLAIQNAQLYQAAQQELAERKQAEEALRRERDKAQRYLDIAGVILVALDERGEITLMNRKGHTILGCGEGELVGKNWFDTCLPANKREEVKRVYEQLMAGQIEPVAYYENPVVTRTGEERMIAWHNTVLTDEVGNITGTLSSGEDITERQQAEDRLKILSLAVEQSTSSIAILNTAGKVEYVNPQILDLYRIRPEEVLGQDWRSLVSADFTLRERLQEINSVVDGEGMAWKGEISDRATDGDLVWREATVFPVKDTQGNITHYVYTSEDITERKQAEEALRQSERKFRSLVEYSSDGIVLIDEGGMIIEWNQARQQITGLERAEVLGRPFWEVSPKITPEEQKDTLSREALEAMILDALRTGQAAWLEQMMEREIQRLDGTRRIIQTRVFPIKTDRGFMAGSISRDVTEQKLTEQMLLQSERLVAMGRLAASVAHEINNPLQSVQTCLTLSRDALERDLPREKIELYLGTATSEIERITDIVRRMRDFYRPAATEMQPTDVHAVLQSVLELSSKQLQHSDVTVECDWDSDLAVIQANADHLKQVFLNLVLNAIDAMPEGGTLRIRTARHQVATRSDRPPQPAVYIEFSDTGKGISAKMQTRVFEPFFTTKEHGSGLGLYISHRIVAAHQGRIKVTSHEGLGSTFSLVLPAAQAQSANRVDRGVRS